MFIQSTAMPRTEQAFEEIREKSSKRILEAAKRVFAKKGLGATVSDIATEAGVSQGLAYRYFSSKEAIFYALLRQMLQSGEVERFSENPEKGPRDRLERFVSETLRLRREHPEFYRFVFQALMDESLPKDISSMFNSQGREIRNILLKLVVDGQAKGEVLKGDPGELVDVILACLEGLSLRMAYSSPEAKVPIPDAEIILRVLGPSRPSREEKV